MENDHKCSQVFLGEGNTKLPLKTKQSKESEEKLYKYWCFTLFEPYIIEDVQSVLNSLGDYLFGVERCPTTNKFHLQGYIKLNKKQRLGTLKKKTWSHIHLERCNGDDKQNEKYCTKCGDIYSNYYEPLNIITPDRPWQKNILEMISGKANDRDVMWIYDTIGNVGKSAISKYILHTKQNCLLLSKGDYKDIINGVFNMKHINSKSVFIFDLPRNNGNKISYSAIESIKNGLIFNTKYETGQKLFNAPHVVVFSNERPEIDKLSKDRWKLYKINNFLELIPENFY